MIYIATPHQGSRIGGGSVQAIGTRLVVLPDPLRAARGRLVAANPPDFFHEPFRKVLPSSIDELEWESPILTALSELAHPPALKVHSIIAVRPGSPPEHRTDGAVSYESAHVAGAASETLVSAGHLCQDCPEVIGEVCRILREHLADTGGTDRGSLARTSSHGLVIKVRGWSNRQETVGRAPSRLGCPRRSTLDRWQALVPSRPSYFSQEDDKHVGLRLAKPDHEAIAHGAGHRRIDDPDPRVPRAVQYFPGDT